MASLDHSSLVRLLSMSRKLAISALLISAALAACSDQTSTLTAPTAASGSKFILPPVAPSNMPTTAPAPGIIYRESFGADNQWRPNGGKGTLKFVAASQSINGFWAEWPNNKNVAWIDGDVAETWAWAGCSLNDN